MYKKDVAPYKRDGKICPAMNAPRSFISVVYVEWPLSHLVIWGVIQRLNIYKKVIFLRNKRN